MLVIGNGRMITQDASNPFLENGAVAMDGNTIVMVGVTEEVKKVYPDAEFVDAKGGVIMPAFINAHEHIYSSFARGLSINGYNPQGFLDILDGLWWTVDRHLTRGILPVNSNSQNSFQIACGNGVWACMSRDSGV